jgi:hypothetical protein
MAALGRLASQRRRSSAAQPSLGEAAARRHRKSSVDTYSNPSYEDVEAGGVSSSGAPAAAGQPRDGGTAGSSAAAPAAPRRQGGPQLGDGSRRQPESQVNPHRG